MILKSWRPVFSPDGSRIAYGTAEPWNTWIVPVIGGEPHLFLPNSSSLTWIEDGKRLLFSEIKEGASHMVAVTTDESRGDSRVVYAPPGERSMVHHAYLSPDGHWVLIVEMDNHGDFLPVPRRAFRRQRQRSAGWARRERVCNAGAWSPDGKQLYVYRARPTTSIYGGRRFPTESRSRSPSDRRLRSASQWPPTASR